MSQPHVATNTWIFSPRETKVFHIRVECHPGPYHVETVETLQRSTYICYFPLSTLKHCLWKKSFCWNPGSEMQFPCHLTAWEAGWDFCQNQRHEIWNYEAIIVLPPQMLHHVGLSEGCKREIGPKHDLTSRSIRVGVEKLMSGWHWQSVGGEIAKKFGGRGDTELWRCKTSKWRQRSELCWLFLKTCWLADIPDWASLLGNSEFWSNALKMCAR